MYEMTATSAESNVLCVPASLGLRAKALTKFVKGSPIAQFIKADLRRRGIAYEGPEVPQGGPWGHRHQFNIADAGFGVRGPRVWNDRAGEVGLALSASDFDLERIFIVEGAKMLHISGLIAAMSPETSQCALAVARIAKASGTLVSFDLNYRATFWQNREEELRAAFSEIASLSDILIGNEEDFQLTLGIEGPETGGKGLSEKIEGFRVMIGRAAERYPNASVFATTLREVISANEHNWGAILRAEGEWFVEMPRPIPIYDRIGGGDGFVSGLLHGIMRDWEPMKWLQFAWATGALAATMSCDYAQPTDERQVWDIYRGNARVQR